MGTFTCHTRPIHTKCRIHPEATKNTLHRRWSILRQTSFVRLVMSPKSGLYPVTNLASCHAHGDHHRVITRLSMLKAI